MKKLLICFSIILILLVSACYKVEAESFEKELLVEINTYRELNGLKELSLDWRLSLLARDFSIIMRDKDQFGHDVVTSDEWNVMSEKRGVDRICNELLVYAPELFPNPYYSFQCLESSPEHRAGMLMKSGVVYGAAFIQGEDCAYVTVYVGGPPRGELYNGN